MHMSTHPLLQELAPHLQLRTLLLELRRRCLCGCAPALLLLQLVHPGYGGTLQWAPLRQHSEACLMYRRGNRRGGHALHSPEAASVDVAGIARSLELAHALLHARAVLLAGAEAAGCRRSASRGCQSAVACLPPGMRVTVTVYSMQGGAPSLRASWKSELSLKVEGEANCEGGSALAPAASAKPPGRADGWGAGTEMGGGRSWLLLALVATRPPSGPHAGISLGAGRASRLADDALESALSMPLGLVTLASGHGEACSSLSRAACSWVAFSSSMRCLTDSELAALALAHTVDVASDPR